MGNCCGNHTRNTDNYLSNQTTSTAHTIHAMVNKDPEKSERNSSEGGVSLAIDEEIIIYSPNLKNFTWSELKNATRNFEKENVIGEGGFGEVYKGWIDEQSLGPTRPTHGIPVAVKKLKPDALQGHKEWLNEVNHLGQLHHQNLVKLIGFCLEGENRLLVYEFMPKGSLENHLFKRNSQPLCWEVRMKVAIDAARGLCFLHDFDHQIIYRDFKASNILLDSEYNAKLSDFGLAKEGPTGDRSHVSTQVLGTQGYAAPEYIATGKLTAKCDVYSFGVVLLELLTGRRALDKTKIGAEQSLVDWAKPYLGDRRKLYRIMDTKLQGQYPQREAFMVGLVASHCIAEPKLRPTMSEILSILQDLPRAKYGTSPDIHFLSSPSSWSPFTYSPKDSPLPRLVDSPSHFDPQESPLHKVRDSPSKLDSRESPLPKFRDSPSKLNARGSPLPRLVKSPSVRRSNDSPMPQYMSYSKGSPLPSYYVNSPT